MDFEIVGLDQLTAAVNRNPQLVVRETKNFLSRGISSYNKIIIRSPWRMGSTGGGSPVAKVNGGNLRDTHARIIGQWEARIYPTAPYAPYVHGLAGYPRRRSYQLRPWLDFAQQQADSQIVTLQNTLLKNIVADLAK
jgi:hypothetical protein